MEISHPQTEGHRFRDCLIVASLILAGAIVGVIGGAFAGALIAAAWDHYTCSTVTQALNGCVYVRPAGLSIVGALIGMIIGPFATVAAGPFVVTVERKRRKDRP